MKKQNLEEASRIIIHSLNVSKIEQLDKVELMKNINNFLDPNEYDDNIKVLQIEKNRKFDNK